MFKDRGILMKITLKYSEKKIKILWGRPLVAGTFHFIRLQAKEVYYHFQALDHTYLPKC